MSTNIPEFELELDQNNEQLTYPFLTHPVGSYRLLLYPIETLMVYRPALEVKNHIRYPLSIRDTIFLCNSTLKKYTGIQYWLLLYT